MALLALFLGGGCRKPMAAPAINVEREIDPWPARVGPELVTIKLSDAGGGAVSGARVKLEGDMAHPGMKPEFGDTREIGPGRYQGRLAFTMPGDWVMLVQIALPGGQTLEPTGSEGCSRQLRNSRRPRSNRPRLICCECR